MYAAPIGSERPSAKPNALPNAEMFPYGDVISPSWDRIGGYYEERNRTQLCLYRDKVQMVEQLSPKVSYEPWLRGKWVHRREKRDITRVVTTSFGYRGLHRLEGRYYFQILAVKIEVHPSCMKVTGAFLSKYIFDFSEPPRPGAYPHDITPGGQQRPDVANPRFCRGPPEAVSPK